MTTQTRLISAIPALASLDILRSVDFFCSRLGFTKVYASCVAFGIVHPRAALETKPWGTREFGIVDPDGNLVTFAEHQGTQAFFLDQA